MKRFKFSLATVHSLREQRKDATERELGRAAAAVVSAIEAADAIARQRDAHEAKLAHLTGQVYAEDLLMELNYLGLLAQREEEARQHVATLERERERCRTVAVTAAREAEVTEQLRQRQQARYAAETARVEQEMLDELSISAHWRGTLREED